MASSAMASAAGVAMSLTTAIVSGSAVAYNVTAVPVARPHMERVTRTAAVVDSLDIHKCSQRKSRFSSLLLPVPPFSGSSSVRAESRRALTVVAKVSETETKSEISVEASEATDELEDTLKSALKSVQEAWDKLDDKLAVGGLGFAALIVLWASTGLIGAIDKLPLIPAVFEFVGILFSGWFVYRYLLFKPDREELLKVIDDAKSKITGQ
ncbi:unnamed protein product [Sphagnum jensenii]|jgi:hypothetical protein|uniref:Cyanobacterial aminoacyl-tRNA synthetase CAAD domain-containing protein n=1 Tax=Sphagnum jensenii TaxID=128206 RepID=A0ABP0VVL6_9BRYO